MGPNPSLCFAEPVEMSPRLGYASMLSALMLPVQETITLFQDLDPVRMHQRWVKTYSFTMSPR